MIRLSRFDYHIEHVPGKLLYTADTLSRLPVSLVDIREITLQDKAEMFAAVAISNLPASTERVDIYKSKIPFVVRSWITAKKDSLKTWGHSRVEAILGGKKCIQDLIMYNSCIVVPMSLQKETLEKLHQGVERCTLLAQNSLWWPGLYRDFQDTVNNCSVCAKLQTPNKEPLIPSVLPNRS